LKDLKITILYFARVKDLVGLEKEIINLSYGTTVETLLANMSLIHPKIKDMLNIIQVAINYKIVNKNTLLRNGDEVAILPPVSGG
jgi:molybdopterin converting factor subunit 1